MKHGKINILILAAFIFYLFIYSDSETFAQVGKNKNVKANTSKKPRFAKKKSLIVSLGVINAHVVKPEDLVKPHYPPAAKAIGVSGAVIVRVLLDENGKVIKATVISGHPLLQGYSVNAAFKSKFKITTLSDVPVKVNGIIVYNFVPISFNWLEIGYTLERKGRDSPYSLENLIKLLPPGFESEEQMLGMVKENVENQDVIFSSVRSAVENKLINQPKQLWLFSLGRILARAKADIEYKESTQNLIQYLNVLRQSVPEEAKQSLVNKLQKLHDSLVDSLSSEYDSEKREVVRQTLNSLLDNMSFFGK